MLHASDFWMGSAAGFPPPVFYCFLLASPCLVLIALRHRLYGLVVLMNSSCIAPLLSVCYFFFHATLGMVRTLFGVGFDAFVGSPGSCVVHLRLHLPRAGRGIRPSNDPSGPDR